MRRLAWSFAAMFLLTSCLGTAVTAERPLPTPGPGSCPMDGVDRSFLRDPGGRCLPPRAIQVVRCGPSLPPVAVRWAGSGHERRFLGGDFAIPVHEVPQGASLLGRGASGQELFVRRGDPQWLWSRGGEVTTRWLVLPTRPPWSVTTPTPGQPSSAATSAVATGSPVTPVPGLDAWFIGDSITDGASPFIVAALPGWTVHVDAVIGRPTVGGITPATTAASAVPPPAAAVVELGTNDQSAATFRADAQRILEALHDVPLVLWQTVHGPMSQVPSINAAIHDLTPTYPNTALANWHGFVTKAMLTSDGVHPLTEHEGAMADLVTPMLETWRAAVEGRGATDCLR
jgi:hypothetical protein